jgi:hypothetical protein
MERDIEKQPYTPDEARVAAFFCEHGVGGGDDPIGAILAGCAHLASQAGAIQLDLAAARAERDALALAVLTLTNERDDARAKQAGGVGC